MAQQNSINNNTSELTVDPVASADSFVQFDINTTGEFKIGVDDTNDSFRISQGSALGTNDTFIMTDAGIRTMPLQPAFLVFTTGTANATGDGTVFTIPWNSEIFDIGSNFNTTTGTFTAPVTGKYRFQLASWYNGLNSSYTSSYIEIVTSNRTYRGGVYDIGLRASTTQSGSPTSVLSDMDVADTCITKTMIDNGPKTVVVGSVNATDLRGSFNGCLII